MSKTNKKIRLPLIFFTSITIAGLILLLYPTVSDWWNKHTQTQMIQTYKEDVEKLDLIDYSAELAKAEEYNKRLYETPLSLYYPEKVDGYEDVLNINGTSVMGYVSIPKIKVRLPIYHGTNENILTTSVGHLYGSSVPVGGENTHSVIAAHRGQPSAKLFTDLDKLDVGDKFTITVFNKVLIYEVDRIMTVLPEETKYLETVDGLDLVTLQTCTPYGVNSHRLLVRGVRVGTTDTNDATYDVEYDVIDAVTYGSNLWVFIGIGSFFLMLITVTIIRRIQSKHDNEKVQVNEDATEEQDSGSS